MLISIRKTKKYRLVVLIPKNWSWNPPKPKTVMVEMLVEDATNYVTTRQLNLTNAVLAMTNVEAAINKALENLK